jgi:hypothetical protein
MQGRHRSKLPWTWMILLLACCTVVMYGYSKSGDAAFNALLTPPGACQINDEHFNTEDGGCKDLSTGIVWSAGTAPNQMSWDYVLNYCENLDEGGYTDWVLPTKEELIEVALNGATSHLAVDPYFLLRWSRDPRGHSAWAVDLSNGDALLLRKVSFLMGLCNRHPASGGSSAPSDLSASGVSTTQIDLTWTDNSPDEERFEIERSLDGVTWPTGPIATVGSDVTGFSDTGLEKKTTYYYRVRAFGPNGYSDYSNTASAKTRNH